MPERRGLDQLCRRRRPRAAVPWLKTSLMTRLSLWQVSFAAALVAALVAALGALVVPLQSDHGPGVSVRVERPRDPCRGEPEAVGVRPAHARARPHVDGVDPDARHDDQWGSAGDDRAPDDCEESCGGRCTDGCCDGEDGGCAGSCAACACCAHAFVASVSQVPLLGGLNPVHRTSSWLLAAMSFLEHRAFPFRPPVG